MQISTENEYHGSRVNLGSHEPLCAGRSQKVSVPTFSYYHAFNFFGRSANITASLPYGVGHYQGKLMTVVH
jgi:hypothetical protein